MKNFVNLDEVKKNAMEAGELKKIRGGEANWYGVLRYGVIWDDEDFIAR